ncbi:hypothetical protein ACS47_01595 [Bacillus cereus]|uniref:hypothetical protein n=1 Tax=Bacillus paranthracis TaxID=2026186 RepID=UPI000515F388|nr:hypothetical protein [Bacillus paranthracis]KMP82060.1 hypothetical protein TU64_20750 [Bacillus cereus]KXI44354.1 hypothetical protein ACS53_02785 [Bacillus cereus]KXI45266.1 hypothetical protein ACS45_00820 [Bacillus cereus]KXI72066.1 hypothetical protein ACS48_01160 [Bacillus cereus]KXI83471.1 hypothetical protein ACS54_01435 [Bacillus cereus]
MVRLVQLLVQVGQLNLVFGLFGLAKAKNQPNFGMQWKKGGDFLSGFLKKYYLPIAWRKTLLGDIERERKRSLDI